MSVSSTTVRFVSIFSAENFRSPLIDWQFYCQKRNSMRSSESSRVSLHNEAKANKSGQDEKSERKFEIHENRSSSHPCAILFSIIQIYPRIIIYSENKKTSLSNAINTWSRRFWNFITCRWRDQQWFTAFSSLLLAKCIDPITKKIAEIIVKMNDFCWSCITVLLRASNVTPSPAFARNPAIFVNLFFRVIMWIIASSYYGYFWFHTRI